MSLATVRTGVATLMLAAAAAAVAQDVTGAGATFPAPLYARWADAYNKATGARINYQSVGSGAGHQADSRQDRRLRRLGHAAHRRANWPRTAWFSSRPSSAAWCRWSTSRVSSPGQLKLTGMLLGDIYLGKITKWNDPALDGAESGRAAARRRHRRRAPGRRLGHDASSSPTTCPRSTSNGRPRSARARQSTGRRAPAARATKAWRRSCGRLPNSIGYVEYAYVKQNKMTYVAAEEQGRQLRRTRRPATSRPRPPVPTGPRPSTRC